MKRIQILGTGCTKFKKLTENAELAVRELDDNIEIEKVTDINEITKFGVMMTPALAIDGTVKSIGKVLSPDEVKDFLKGD